MPKTNKAKQKFTRIIVAYPIVLTLIALVVNWFVFGVSPAIIALPTLAVMAALSVSAVLLLVNHTWLMTSTELTRLKYNMHITHEEWAKSEHREEDVSAEGKQAFERQINAHRNATENVVYFIIPAILVCFITPVAMAAQVWFVGFATGRLGHTFAYLTKRDGLRGLFMSVSLLSVYGLATYLLISLMV